MLGVVSPKTGPVKSGDDAADEEEEDGRRDGAAATDPQPRGDERDAGRQADQQRLEDQAVLRHAEVELGLERRQADEEATHDPDAAQLGDERQVVALGRGREVAAALAADRHALGEQQGLADEREPRAADEHEVRRAPERDVLAEEAVPHVVEREAEQGEGAAGGHEDRADGRVPVLADLDRGPAGLSPRGSTMPTTPATKRPKSPKRMR
jgi:hypothetical protein